LRTLGERIVFAVALRGIVAPWSINQKINVRYDQSIDCGVDRREFLAPQIAERHGLRMRRRAAGMLLFTEHRESERSKRILAEHHAWLRTCADGEEERQRRHSHAELDQLLLTTKNRPG
jgi:hypothetical protein